MLKGTLIICLWEGVQSNIMWHTSILDLTLISYILLQHNNLH